MNIYLKFHYFQNLFIIYLFFVVQKNNYNNVRPRFSFSSFLVDAVGRLFFSQITGWCRGRRRVRCRRTSRCGRCLHSLHAFEHETIGSSRHSRRSTSSLRPFSICAAETCRCCDRAVQPSCSRRLIPAVSRSEVRRRSRRHCAGSSAWGKASGLRQDLPASMSSRCSLCDCSRSPSVGAARSSRRDRRRRSTTLPRPPLTCAGWRIPACHPWSQCDAGRRSCQSWTRRCTSPR